MKISTNSVRAVITRHFTIETDHPVVPMAYSTASRKVRIEGGTIRYTWADRAWVTGEWNIDITGSVLKKDGTPGKSDHTRHPETAKGYSTFRNYTPAEGWEWMGEIVDLLRPDGNATLTLFRSFETEH